jgi:uncharacterized protein
MQGNLLLNTDPPPGQLREKAERLRRILVACQPAVLAVSGGIDSRLLAGCARVWSLDIQGLILTGPQFASQDTEQAAGQLRRLGLTSHVQPVDTLRLPEVSSNSRQRCYVCKKALFQAALDRAEQLGASCVLEGSQRSDEAEHRPGRRALDELGVISPLLQAGMFKPEVRALAAHLGLPDPQQPSRPCLLTRFKYDSRVTHEELEQVAWLEAAISRLGFGDFRVRVPEPGRCLLQIMEADRPLAEGQAGRLEELIERSGFRHGSVRITERISGFFDQ